MKVILISIYVLALPPAVCSMLFWRTIRRELQAICNKDAAE